MVNIPIDGSLLRRRRDAARLTQRQVCDKAAEAGVQISERNYSRFENEGSISREVLEFVAGLLGVVPSHFQLNPKDNYVDGERYVGRWLGRFVEKDIQKRPEIVEEQIDLSFDSSNFLQGTSTVLNTSYPRTDVYRRVSAVGDVLTLELDTEGWREFPAFCLLKMSRPDWLDGVTGWVDPDIGGVQWSRYVWIRHDSVHRDLYLTQAMSIMKDEAAVFAERLSRDAS